MSYILQSDLEGAVPPDFLVQALDDNRDGVIDAWDAVSAQACEAVDGVLGIRFAVPFSPAPAVVKRAARVFALELVYLRRGVKGDDNPWTAQADDIRKQLKAIAAGEMPLGPTINRQQPSVSVVTEPARTSSAAGHLSA